jgi:hypothetical protein
MLDKEIALAEDNKNNANMGVPFKEFCLSESIFLVDANDRIETEMIKLEDVKEFIRLLKEFMQGNSKEEPVIIGKLDELAGEKLI